MPLLATLLELGGLLGFTWTLLARYKDKDVALSVHIAVFVSWVLGFLGLLLLPMDIALNGIEQDTSNFDIYVTSWRVLYWMTFFMSWIVLPFLSKFVQSGEFELENRIKASIKALFLHWTFIVGLLIVLMAYLILVDHFTLYGLKGLAMASTNTYGLLWIIFLLGYGLVSIPKSLWLLRHPENRLKKLYFRAVQTHEERMEAIFMYEEVVRDVRKCHERMVAFETMSIILTNEMQELRNYLQQVMRSIENDGAKGHAILTKKKSSSITNSTSSLHTITASAPTKKEIIDLHRRLRTLKTELRTSEQAWIAICMQAESLLEKATKKDIPTSCCIYPEETNSNFINHLRNYFMIYHWKIQHVCMPYLYGIMSFCCFFFSLCIFWSELTMGWGKKFSILLIDDHLKVPQIAEIWTFSILIYLIVCSYWSLFTMRMFGKFALRAHQNSSDLCLITSAIYQSRVQFSLSFNFLLLLNQHQITKRTAFHHFFQEIQVVHFFGTEFSVYAPILMIILAGFTLTNGYAHVMKNIGIEQYTELILGNTEHETQILQGETLVRKGIEKYQAICSNKQKKKKKFFF